MSQPANTPKTNRTIIIALIALLTVAVLVLSLVVSGALSSTEGKAAAPSSSTSQPKENTETKKELTPEIKAIIEQQHRKVSNDPRALGNVDAPVIIEMYSDYRCGHCRQWSLETLPKLQDFIDSGKIRIEYNSMPVLGDESVLIAQASHAAALQNKFWEYHHELFANAPEAKPEALTELAGKIGMDTEKFAADLKDPETVKAVDTERSRGTSLGITGTPAFLIGYSFVPGAYPADQFIKIINQELQRAENHK